MSVRAQHPPPPTPGSCGPGRSNLQKLWTLRASAGHLSLTVPLDATAYADRITETVAAVSDKETELYIRLLVTRGVGDLTYDPNSCPDPTAVIIVRPYAGASPELDQKGITVVRTSIVRNHPAALNPIIKSNNLLNNALAMQEAIKAGADEALMCNYRGEIAECAQSNIFLVRNGEALTPPLATGPRAFCWNQQAMSAR